MLLLLTIIHLVFIAFFWLIHRYIEMGVVVGLWIVLCSIFIPTSTRRKSTIQHPDSLTPERREKNTFEQSLFLSSGILFYTALIWVVLGVAGLAGMPLDRTVVNICIFFLTSVIFGIYIFTYPRNPNIFILFRFHSVICSVLVGAILLAGAVFHMFPVEILMFVNAILLLIALIMVVIFERDIPLDHHIAAVYLVLALCVIIVISTGQYFSLDYAWSLVGVLVLFFPAYYWLAPLFGRYHITSCKPLLVWHFRNTILALSWVAFISSFYGLFWGSFASLPAVYSSILLLFWFWIFAYLREANNPLFFSGIIGLVCLCIAYLVFVLIPPIFWLITLILFVFAGGLLLISNAFRNRAEELILAWSAVIFLYGTDIILLLQQYSFFSVSMVFFFQSLVLYGAYEVFHRNKIGQLKIKN